MTLSVERQDRLYAWGGSLVFHALLSLIMYFVVVSPTIVPPAVVEVTFAPMVITPPVEPRVVPTVSASATKTAKPARAKPALSGKAMKGSGGAAPRTKRVTLPQRSSVSRDEVLTVPRGKKLDAPEGTLGTRRSGVTGTGRPTGTGGTPRGSRTGDPATGRDALGGTGAGRSTAGIGVTETGSSALGSVQWIGGGKRRKISGALPAYPAGVNVATQIKMEAVVAPDGKVRSVRPALKGDVRLEDAASRVLRTWRFEPLPRAYPQRDQRCVVTFNFTLR